MLKSLNFVTLIFVFLLTSFSSLVKAEKISYFFINQTLIEFAQEGDVGEVKSLIESGVNVNLRDDFGRTILTYASEEGQIEVVKVLLEAGVDVNARADSGLTALRYALLTGQLEMVEFLLEVGATK